jgi:hypothetical protein
MCEVDLMCLVCGEMFVEDSLPVKGSLHFCSHQCEADFQDFADYCEVRAAEVDNPIESDFFSAT